MIARHPVVALVAALGVFLAREARADPPDVAAVAVELAAARHRYHRALDDARWNREAPAVRALADELTGELLERYESPSPLHDETRALLIELGGDALGPWLVQRRALTDAHLVGAWLRRHDDPELIAQAMLAGAPLQDLLPWVARHRALRALPLLVEARQHLPSHDTDTLCASALQMPDARVRELAALMRDELHALPASPQCAALLATSPEGRQVLAAQLAPGPGPSPRAGIITLLRALPSVAAALLLLPGAHGPAAQRALDRVLAPSPDGLDRVTWRHDLAAQVSVIGPQLALDNPRVAAATRRLLNGPLHNRRLLPLYVRLRDPSLLPPLLDAMASMRLSDDMNLASALAAVGLTTPAQPAAVARSAAALRELRARIAPYNVQEVSVAQVDLWLDALDATARCHDAACLRALLTSGSDPAAARAAWLLGAAGLAELDDDEASALVRRVVLEARSPAPAMQNPLWAADALLTLAVLPTVRGCPPRLRGLRLTPEFSRHHPLHAWRESFDRQCRVAGGEGG